MATIPLDKFDLISMRASICYFDDVDEAVKQITDFYRNLHSYRWVREKMVIRIQRPITKEALESLNDRFANIKRVAERKLVQLDAAPSLNFMKAPPGNDLKAYGGAWHVRINGQWRLTFKWGVSGPFDVRIEDPH